MDLRKHLINPKDKNEKWAADLCREFFASFRESWFYNKRDTWVECDRYAEGRQPVDKYKEKVRGALDDGSSPVNINWDTIDVLPQALKVLRGLVAKKRRCSITAVDPVSSSQKLIDRFSTEAMIRYKPLFELVGEEVPNIAMDEIETYHELKPKEKFEAGMEVAVDYVFRNNDAEEFFRTLDDSLMRYGVVCATDNLRSDGYIELEPVDPKLIVMEDSKYRDFRDAEFFGVQRSYSLHELMNMDTDLSMAEYKFLANNAPMASGRRYSTESHEVDSAGYPIWQSNKLRCVKFTFKTVDEKYYQDRKNQHGESRFTEEQFGKTKTNRSKRKISKKRWTKWMTCIWVEGTDYVFNLKYMENMKTPPDNIFNTPPNFYVYRMTDKSVVESARGIVDDINLDWFNKQNIKAKAVPDSIIIDWDALFDAIPDGSGGTYQPSDIVKMYKKGEPLFYRSKPEDMEFNGRSGPPVTPLPGGMGRIFEQFTQEFFTNIELLNKTLGIAQTLAANNPEARTPVRASMMAEQGTQVSLQTHRHAMKNIYKRLSESIVLRIQDYVRYKGDMDVYEYGIGDEIHHIFKVTKDIVPKRFALEVEEEPSPDEVEAVFGTASQLKQQRDASGMGGIDLSDFLDVHAFLNSGRLKQAKARLELAKKKAHRMDMERQQMQSQMNAQVQAQASQQAEQAKQQTLQMEIQSQAQLEKIKFDFALQLEKFKSERDMAEKVEEEKLRKLRELELNKAKYEEQQKLEIHKSQLFDVKNKNRER